ncbi:ATP-binding protein [Streptomyces xanthochromogenes]|uniref:ATP-binding protein n=1 Tax=Streptomyces xanthochromogenes TaxID=67384 RepID=UPI00380A18A2
MHDADGLEAVVAPRASALMDSLRAFGYDMATALADLVDNSISASAREVRVEFCTDEGAAWVAAVDDGDGMTEKELHEAVRFGGSGPTMERRTGDLGRFGLGLKTASLSQCRVLTVLSRTPHGLVCRTWDIDLVRAADDWRVRVVADEEAVGIAHKIGFEGSGTMVLWRRLDHAGEGASLARKLGQSRSRLRMWFHRYIARGRLRLTVGGHVLAPWDPFCRQNMATQDLGTERLGAGGQVQVIPYVLPHPSRLSEAEIKDSAGPRGWNAQQGFYVYRGDRMVSAGGWLGLPEMVIAPQTRLARIEISMDPASDHLWQVDVRKSRVHPPAGLEEDLTRLAAAAREASVAVFRRRATNTAGRQGRDRELTFGWIQERRHGTSQYLVNRQHPVVQAALAAGPRAHVEALLRMVERTLPVGVIAIEAENDLGRTHHAALEGVEEAEARADLEVMLAALPDDAQARVAAVRALASVEPFNRFPDMVTEIVRQMNPGV